MAEDTGRTKIWRVIPFILIILVMLVGGGIALAGVPAAVPAGIGVAPPAQGKGSTQPLSKPQTSFAGTPRKLSLAPPAAPNVTLYDQYNNAAANSTSSQDFETAFDAFDDQVADDFVVPSGQTWQVNEVDVAGVYFNCTTCGPA